jgi:hypothetical protein
MLGTLGMGMPTPNYWKTISVGNDGTLPVELSVSFGDNLSGHHVITNTHTLGAGELFTFPEQEYDEDGWTSVASVQEIAAQCVELDGSLLGERHIFRPQPMGGVEAAHSVHLNCVGQGAAATF